MVKFCFDLIIDNTPRPNLALWQAKPKTPSWKQYSKNWPYSEPLHFLEYLDKYKIDYIIDTVENADRDFLYPISISYLDLSIQWFELLPPLVLEKLKQRSLRLIFFYSEADNPYKIKQHIDAQREQAGIKEFQVLFVSANSAADSVDYFFHFVDDELLFGLRNTGQVEVGNWPRAKQFTALVRTHKRWRANTMAWLWRQNLHELGYFGYNNSIRVDDETPRDNPIDESLFHDLGDITDDFLKAAPFRADNLDSDAHNLYATNVWDHYSNAYLNLVLETHLDIDGTNGVFFSEKTFKPIKHGQMFMIFGAANSLKLLKDLGYRTFDHVIDNSYDSIKDNSLRWHAAINEATRLITHPNLRELYFDCQDDLIHNQNLFHADKQDRLNTLLKKITNDNH